MTGDETLLEDLLAGEHRALARVISKIENRAPGYRELVSALYAHAGDADVIGVTGSPGAGKSTLVDKLAETYRERGETVGVIAIDPSSPFTGGAVLGDRIRMASTVGDMDVFVRSMSARGTLGGLSTATADAVKAMDAFGKDKVIIETVGAGQNEIDIVRTADTVAVLVPPGSGDDIQTLKAGILEIGDVFVVNKADRDGADRTVQELREMIHLGEGSGFGSGHHGADEITDHHPDWDGPDETDGDTAEVAADWSPPIVETVATTATGIDDLIDEFTAHQTYLVDSGTHAAMARQRYAEEIRTLLREDVHAILEDELERVGGIDDLADAVRAGETDPYTIADELLEPVEACVSELGTDSAGTE
ncbi:methylmalonyl Co-A mutase-associated GTPase MeaB [Natrarchaeobaculum sulfurireducens]|uniref:Putative periplasmic protein kinase ArgK and related GTPases of G3E family n=1 Tax=Natrarchaeobaculum sulfurireducens TaxID=2044521 RepID=A0A346PNB5_9EURY|nr:methylmalonyl Co-A mutase-associated GTPase MeaB [Natrarchaeobaculum sulfurireducens]AXR81010.1 putative periplasmic protein kinase ArgK and related GTPases of G3E family [Natrarchaeobaculum sulfurireducens]